MSKEPQTKPEKKGLFSRAAGPQAGKPAAKKKPGKPFNLLKIFRETSAELKKVSWPTRKELIGYTTIVCVFVLIIAAVIGVFDLGLSAAYTALFGV